MMTSRFFLSTKMPFFIGVLLLLNGSNTPLIAADDLILISSQTTRTVVAEVLEVEGDFHIVRGERGEIRIEVTSDTKVSEIFTFGDRIKAVLLPNDVALTIVRASPDEPIETITNEPTEPPPTSSPTEAKNAPEDDSAPSLAPTHKIPKVRIIIADILMVDGSFYIVRTEDGEIQIEITPETKLSEDFKFGDKIKAQISPADKAFSVVRATKDEPIGIQNEAVSAVASTPTSPASPPPSTNNGNSDQKTSAQPVEESTPSTRTIVADVLMVDGDLYVLRGERGEIRIEVTPDTQIAEPFDFGDRVKAEVLSNDKALTITRASPDDPPGITQN